MSTFHRDNWNEVATSALNFFVKKSSFQRSDVTSQFCPIHFDESYYFNNEITVNYSGSKKMLCFYPQDLHPAVWRRTERPKLPTRGSPLFQNLLNKRYTTITITTRSIGRSTDADTLLVIFFRPAPSFDEHT